MRKLHQSRALRINNKTVIDNFVCTSKNIALSKSILISFAEVQKCHIKIKFTNP